LLLLSKPLLKSRILLLLSSGGSCSILLLLLLLLSRRASSILLLPLLLDTLLHHRTNAVVILLTLRLLPNFALLLPLLRLAPISVVRAPLGIVVFLLFLFGFVAILLVLAPLSFNAQSGSKNKSRCERQTDSLRYFRFHLLPLSVLLPNIMARNC
jgi:hypothetical protein